MNRLDELRALFHSFFNRENPNGREMKRVFQWRRYFEWKDLTAEEKLLAKRFLLVPIFAYFLIGIFNQNLLLIVLLLIGYVLYKKLEKGNIVKK
tara:strand:+ start:275 stop:556 length:282 start_codon:yes stop_codon:yes gene_type:complete